MLHQYKLGGYNIVLDTCSGSVHAVDEVAYDIISLFQNNTEDDITALMLKKYAGREDVSVSPCQVMITISEVCRCFG